MVLKPFTHTGEMTYTNGNYVEVSTVYLRETKNYWVSHTGSKFSKRTGRRNGPGAGMCGNVRECPRQF